MTETYDEDFLSRLATRVNNKFKIDKYQFTILLKEFLREEYHSRKAKESNNNAQDNIKEKKLPTAKKVNNNWVVDGKFVVKSSKNKVVIGKLYKDKITTLLTYDEKRCKELGLSIDDSALRKSYYNNNGKYQQEYRVLIKAIAEIGKCRTVAGELMRAATRLSHEFYNNGMCNNYSPYLYYLNAMGIFKDHENIYDTLFVCGEDALTEAIYKDENTNAIESMMDLVIEKIIKNPELKKLTNKEDMNDYRVKDEEWYGDED